MMTRKFSRRTLVRGAAAAGATAALARFPAPAIAQSPSIKVGLLTVKTGPLAQGGVQMEQGVLTFLKDNNAMMGGRKVELFSADTGGNPAGAKTKAQELIEHDKVDVILGPLATFELYAINDYIREQKVPTFSVAAADDLTQRHPNPYLLRAGATASGAMHVMGHYAATELKLKRVVTAGEDLSYDYEEMGGFQAAFAASGGCIVNKLWPPLVTPDYTPYRNRTSRPDSPIPPLPARDCTRASNPSSTASAEGRIATTPAAASKMPAKRQSCLDGIR